MESVAIFPVTDPSGSPTFRAVAKTGQSEGRTVGEALDAIRTQFPSKNAGMVVVIQTYEHDSLLTAQQQQRLQDLMKQWRTARDQGQALPADTAAELESLVENELQAAESRTRELLQGLNK